MPYHPTMIRKDRPTQRVVTPAPPSIGEAIDRAVTDAQRTLAVRIMRAVCLVLVLVLIVVTLGVGLGVALVAGAK